MTDSPMAFHEVKQHQKRNDRRQDKSCFYPACKDNWKKEKKITIKIYHPTKSIYSSVVRNSYAPLL